MENGKIGIAICIDSDELRRRTLTAALEACDAIAEMADISIMSGSVYRTNVVDHYNRYNLEMMMAEEFKMKTKHEYETYGWYRKFEKKRF